MSQAGIINTSSGPVPPSVATSYETQSGTAVPAANILIVRAFDTTENNDNGIETKGGTAAGDPPGAGLTNELDVYLTNRTTGIATTTNNTPTTIITFDLGEDPGTYYFSGNLQAFNTSTPASGGYSFSSAFRTDGFSCVEVGGAFDDQWEDVVLEDSNITFEPSGNNAVLSVVGINGLTINWNALIEYRRVL